MTEQTDREPIVARLLAAGCVRAQDEATLLIAAADTPAQLTALVERRVDGEPLEHVLGWAGFDGMRVRVAPGVFVPRHRSEHAVAVATRLLPAGADPPPIVVDLCAGSGALGLALHRRAGPFRLVAVDLDRRAVRCAAANLTPVGGTALVGDLFAPLDPQLRGRVALVLASPPYVPSTEIDRLPREAHTFEPVAALDGGPDGLSVLRRILAGAAEWLAPDGVVVVELSAGQAAPALTFAASLAADARIVVSGRGRRPDSPAVLVARYGSPRAQALGSSIGPPLAAGK